MYFEYGEAELSALRQKDKRLCMVIDRIGHINRTVDTDLFSSVIHHIIGQQISSKAQKTIWQRMQNMLGEVNVETVRTAGAFRLQALGMTFRKAEYITDFAEKVHSGVFQLDAVKRMNDKEAIQKLCALKGIGTWTAEMILLFCLQRSDIFSYDDLAIQRGLRMVYHHRKINRRLFEKYRRRFAPYGSIASLYLWAVAGGAIPEMQDYKPKRTKEKEKEKKMLAKHEGNILSDRKRQDIAMLVNTCRYDSPFGGILLAADEIGLCGLWFDGEKYFADSLPVRRREKETPILTETKRWLDIYFTGRQPDFWPPLHPAGSAFRQAVWEILLQIPYGKTTTYGEIARKLAKKRGIVKMSAQAVGGAVGHNEISILIPCHRVVGANGSLTGYAGGLDKKVKLLELEHVAMDGFFIPKKGTAL